MGSQIGCEFAIGGHEVVYLVQRLDAATRRVDAAFALAGTLDLWTTAAVQAGRERVSFVSSVSELDPATELFVESIAEDRAPKIAILRDAADRLPNAILASNTSSLSIGELGTGCGAASRTIGMHYWNPPLLMPLVEVISGPESDLAHIERAMHELRAIGKRPVHVDRDVPGFVWNRLQLALLREAVWIVENGVASPEVVDEIVADGLARRWSFTGPFTTAALGGASNFAKIARNLWPVLSDADSVDDLSPWIHHTEESLAAAKAYRDAGLLELLRRERTRDAAG